MRKHKHQQENPETKKISYDLRALCKQTTKQTKNVKDEINREYIIQTYQIIKFDS